MLCRRLKRNLPAWKDEYRGMTFERTSKYLRPLDPEIDPAILDSGEGGLGYPREFGQLALAQLLKLAKDTNGFARRDFDSFFGRTELLHFMASCNREV